MDEKPILEQKTTLEERRKLAERWVEPEQIEKRRLIDEQIEEEIEAKRIHEKWAQGVEELRKEALKPQYENLYEEIYRILTKHDPMIIDNGNNTGDYYVEVETILPRLNKAKSEIDVLNIVLEEFCHWFWGSNHVDFMFFIQKEFPLYKDASKEIWEAWGRHCQQSD